MADKVIPILLQTLKPIKIIKWKVNEGNSISIGCVFLLYEVDEDDKHGVCKLKSTQAGTVHKLLVQEGDVVKPGEQLLQLKPCAHPTVMSDMCAECGADLRKDDSVTLASVPMVHSVPELKVSLEQAQKIGKADVDRLLKDRKLVLLVDLDQTLIHTTNDNIPANIKDVYHFQLYGPQSPWYHTRLRPGTHKFLENMSPYFELHICTFGARNYAHMIAMFLDQDGKLFSQRILSRDECFNPTSKTANLKALFPCGDDLVCIIDDREDVWSHAANLIHVKPYHFFQHTGDINAPPGLDKHESDEKEGIDLSKLKQKKIKANGLVDQENASKECNNTDNEEKENNITEENDEEKIDNNMEINSNESEKDANENCNNEETITETESEKDNNADCTNEEETNTKTESGKGINVDCNNEEIITKTESEKDANANCSNNETIKTKSENDANADCNNEEETTTKTESEKDANADCTNEEETTTKIESEREANSDCNKKETVSKTESEKDAKEETATKTESEEDAIEDCNDEDKATKTESAKDSISECNNEETATKTESETTKMEDVTSNDAEDFKEDSEPKVQNNLLDNDSKEQTETNVENNCNKMEVSEIKENAVSENLNDKEKSNEQETESELDNKENNDLANIKSYSNNEKDNESKEDELIEIEDPDDYLVYLEDILKIIHKTFYDKYDKLEGKVPDLKKVIPEVRRNVLKNTNLVFSGLVPTHIKLEQSKAYQVARSLGANVTQDLQENTTHLVAVRPGTAKVNAGRRKKNLKIVTPDWLWSCAERWSKVDERLYNLNNKGSKNRHPPPHCSSPEHFVNFDDIQETTSRKRTPSGRFMDTINPLMSFSRDDIADMDREVEDIFNESESEGESKKPTEADVDQVILQKLKKDKDSDEESSSSDESLTGEHPHGWRPNVNSLKRSREDQDLDDESTADEFPSTKFRRGEELSSDLDIGQDSNSEGSVDAPDEIDDGDWNMMGAALEREFLANN